MRVLGGFFFLALVGAIAWLVVSTGRFGNLDAAAPTEDLGVAEAAADGLRDLGSVVDDALRNAQQAAALAEEMERAAERARRAANDLGVLVADNEAARPSAEAAMIAADDAEEAALLMRRYAEALQTRFRRADVAADEAEAIAEMVVDVEQTQAAAALAADAARAARAEMARTAEVASDLDLTGAERDDLRGEIVLMDRTEPAGTNRAEDDKEDEAVRDRLERIFPGDVIEYDEDDEAVPYGERG